MSKKQIELGDKVQDTVTGFTGIAVAHTQWLHGCIRWQVQSSKVDKDGKPGPIESFDNGQLKLIKKHVVPTTHPEGAPTPARPVNTGGPRPTTGRQPNPPR